MVLEPMRLYLHALFHNLAGIDVAQVDDVFVQTVQHRYGTNSDLNCW